MLTVSFILAKITNEMPSSLYSWQWFWCCLEKSALCVGEDYSSVILWKLKAWQNLKLHFLNCSGKLMKQVVNWEYVLAKSKLWFLCI